MTQIEVLKQALDTLKSANANFGTAVAWRSTRPFQARSLEADQSATSSPVGNTRR